eukprot:g2551.t1
MFSSDGDEDVNGSGDELALVDNRSAWGAGGDAVERISRRRRREAWRRRRHTKKTIREAEEVADCLGLGDCTTKVPESVSMASKKNMWETEYPRLLECCGPRRLSKDGGVKSRARIRKIHIAVRSPRKIGIYALCDFIKGELIEECAYVLSRTAKMSRLCGVAKKRIWTIALPRSTNDSVDDGTSLAGATTSQTSPAREQAQILVLGNGSLYARSFDDSNASWCFKGGKVCEEEESDSADRQFVYVFATRSIRRGEEVVLTSKKKDPGAPS